MANVLILLPNQWTDYTSIISLIISIIALWITWKSFLLKIWDKYKTLSYSSQSSIQNSDDYISSVTIQNLQDRPLVVFKIYFQLWYNLFIELEDFEEKPLIIKPFEVYQWNYWPILFYWNSWFERYIINKLIHDKTVKKKFILETVEGKYKKSHVLHKFFKNYYTWIISPFRLMYNDKYYWEEIDFIVDFIHQNWKTESVWISKKNFRWVFRNVSLEEEHLVSVDTLKEYLNLQREKWNFICDQIDVLDWKKKLNDLFNYDKLKKIDLPKVTFLEYYFLWKIDTFFQKIKTKIKNSKLVKKK